MTGIGKENRSKQLLAVRDGEKEEGKKKEKKKKVSSHKQSKGLDGVLWVYKVGLK